MSNQQSTNWEIQTIQSRALYTETQLELANCRAKMSARNRELTAAIKEKRTINRELNRLERSTQELREENRRLREDLRNTSSLAESLQHRINQLETTLELRDFELGQSRARRLNRLADWLYALQDRLAIS